MEIPRWLQVLSIKKNWNPDDPCFERSSGLLLEGSNTKIEDKQVPGYMCMYALNMSFRQVPAEDQTCQAVGG